MRYDCVQNGPLILKHHNQLDSWRQGTVYIICILNLAARILQKWFLREPEEIQGRVFRNLLYLQFIEQKLVIVIIEADNTLESYPKF